MSFGTRLPLPSLPTCTVISFLPHLPTCTSLPPPPTSLQEENVRLLQLALHQGQIGKGAAVNLVQTQTQTLLKKSHPWGLGGEGGEGGLFLLGGPEHKTACKMYLKLGSLFSLITCVPSGNGGVWQPLPQERYLRSNPHLHSLQEEQILPLH